LTDLDAKQQGLDQDYQARSFEHDTEERRLQGEVNQANIDIANTQSLLENVLYVNRDNLNNDIAQLKQNIADNQAAVVALTNERNAAHAEFLDEQAEHESAISAIDEAVGLLISLGADDDEDAFVQVKATFHKKMTAIANTLKKSPSSALVKTLVNLKSMEFANAAAVRQVQNLLLSVQQDLRDSLAAIEAAEAQDLQDFNDEVAAKDLENNQFSFQIHKDGIDLEHTENEIAFQEQYLSIRQFDLINWQKDLDAENASFEEATNVYNDTIARCEEDRATITDAQSYLQNNIGSFSGTITDRLDAKQGAGLSRSSKTSVN